MFVSASGVEAGSPNVYLRSLVDRVESKRTELTDDMLIGSREREDVRSSCVGPVGSRVALVFFSLLFSVGAETTCNAVVGGLLVLAGHSRQLYVA